MIVRHLDIHLTHRCSLRCSYCYAANPSTELPPDLSPECADRAVQFLFDHAGDAKRLRIDLWGGEPFIRLDLIERIASHATKLADERQKSIRIGMPTNVTLLSNRALDVVRRWDLQLSLSLDGTPDAHEQRHTPDGRNGWVLIEPRLMNLIERWNGPLPPVRMTIVPQRADRVQQDVNFLHSLGFQQIAFMPASGIHWSKLATEQLDESLDALVHDLAIKVVQNHPIPMYQHLLRRVAPLWVETRVGSVANRRGVCGAGETMLAVDTLGDLYPCHRVVAMSKPPIDLRLGSLSDGVTNHVLVDKIAAVSATAPHVRCASCEHRLKCGTICIALNHRTTGDVACVPDEGCFVTERLRLAAKTLHDLLVGNPRYDKMMQAYVDADLDDRFLPLLSSLESDVEMSTLLDDVENMLTGAGKE